MRLLELENYQGILIIGHRGSGKSALLEFLGEQFYKAGRLVLDLFDPGNFESCFWCIPRKKAYPILLVHPRYCEVDVSRSPYDIEVICDDMGLETICRKAIEERRIVCLAGGLYEEDHKFDLLTYWIKRFRKLNQFKLKTPSAILIREASNVIYSHLRPAKQSSDTRKALLNAIRFCRHFNSSVIFDTQRLMDIYKAIRDNLDRICIKYIPEKNIPSLLENEKQEIEERYYLVKPERYPEISYLRNDEFYWTDGTSELYFENNPLPSFRHKDQNDYFDKIADITFHELEDIPRNLNKQEQLQLEYLSKGLSYFLQKIYQKELMINGEVPTLNSIAKIIGISMPTLRRYNQLMK